MTKVIGKERRTHMIAFKVVPSQYERLKWLKAHTVMDVNETLRQWLDEVLEDMEREAPKYPLPKAAG